MPVLLFHTDSNPFVFIIEIFLAFVWPYPALFLNITATLHVLVEVNGSVQKFESVEKSTYKKLPGNMRCGGTKISSKKSRPTAVTINKRATK